MEIFKYEIIGKKTNKNLPFFDKEKGIFVFCIDGIYNWYCEARTYNISYDCYDYYLLMGKDKVNIDFKHCRRDNLGRYKIRPSDELKEWFEKYYNVDSGNFDVNYLETVDNYDIYSIE